MQAKWTLRQVLITLAALFFIVCEGFTPRCLQRVWMIGFGAVACNSASIDDPGTISPGDTMPDSGKDGTTGGGNSTLSEIITIRPSRTVMDTPLTAVYSRLETVSCQRNKGGAAEDGETQQTYTSTTKEVIP